MVVCPIDQTPFEDSHLNPINILGSQEMNELTSISKITRALPFLMAVVIVGYFVVRFVAFTRRELDEFSVWMAGWIFGLLAGLFHTLIHWEQCRKAPVSQLLLVTLMTFVPCLIVIAIMGFIGGCAFGGHVGHLAK